VNLTLVVFLPVAGAIVLALAGLFSQGVSDRAMRDNALKAGALIVSLVTFVLSLAYIGASPDPVYRAWIPSIGSVFHLRMDGISIWLFVLTTFLTPICVLASWRNIRSTPSGSFSAYADDPEASGERGVAGFMVALLTLETAMLGTFVAYDLVLFFVFWEMMLIPMYLLIGIWGSPGTRSTFLFGRVSERIYATMKFVLYTMAGSALMLVGILYLRAETGSFDLAVVTAHAAEGFDKRAQYWLFWAFFVAFAIKVPLFPFHTWLPDAHTQAPTAGSIILAGVMLKMGTYGIIRFCIPLFPDAALFYAPFVSVLAVIGIIYGALVAMVQPDMKRLVAYSSVSHLGFIVLGLFSGTNAGVQGAVIQMVSHGISTGALFMLVGMLYDRRHTRLISEFGGIAKRMPAYAAVFLIVTFSSIGLPGTNGFVGEFLILLGTFSTQGRAVYAVFAALGVILAAVYMLWMVQRVFFGPIKHRANENLNDLTLRELVVAVPLVVVVFLIGVFPKYFLDRMDADHAISELRKAGSAKEIVRVSPQEGGSGHGSIEVHTPAGGH
jgi:NADH-quinone oxidoreductase subunit M